MSVSRRACPWSLLAVLVALAAFVAACRQGASSMRAGEPTTASSAPTPAPLVVVRRWEDVDRDIAARFAPHFYQGIIGRERFDYITNFDFDGDWHGENNWDHAADPQFRMKAYVYYSVSETPTHYFIHYAAFHPRDWKGGERTGRFLSGTIHESTTVGGTFKARGLMDDLVLSHENDLEGCLVVAAKHGPALEAARVVLVETMAHNQYLRFMTEPPSNASPLRLEDQHPLLYVEAQGHGIMGFHDQPVEAAETAEPEATDADASGDEPPPLKKGRFERMKRVTRVPGMVTSHLRIEGMPTSLLVYRFSGTAEDPETAADGPIGYDLLPLYSTLWKAASAGENETFGEAVDYGTRTITVAGSESGASAQHEIKIGMVGAALRGVAGARNKARAPWGWFDRGERNRPLGEWFFDPATTVARHLGALARDWATAYLHEPFLGVIRSQAITSTTTTTSSATTPVAAAR